MAEIQVAVPWQCLSLIHSFSVASANIAVSHTLLKTKFFGLYFCRYIKGLWSTTLT